MDDEENQEDLENGTGHDDSHREFWATQMASYDEYTQACRIISSQTIAFTQYRDLGFHGILEFENDVGFLKKGVPILMWCCPEDSPYKDIYLEHSHRIDGILDIIEGSKFKYLKEPRDWEGAFEYLHHLNDHFYELRLIKQMTESPADDIDIGYTKSQAKKTRKIDIVTEMIPITGEIIMEHEIWEHTKKEKNILIKACGSTDVESADLKLLLRGPALHRALKSAVTQLSALSGQSAIDNVISLLKIELYELTHLTTKDINFRNDYEEVKARFEKDPPEMEPSF